VVLIAAGFVVNVLLYVFVVASAEPERRHGRAAHGVGEQAKTAAQTEFNSANSTLTGKDRATQELKTFLLDGAGAGPVWCTATDIWTHAAARSRRIRLAYQGSRYEPVEERAARSRSSR
jgi:hypothetical protein